MCFCAFGKKKESLCIFEKKNEYYFVFSRTVMIDSVNFILEISHLELSNEYLLVFL